MACCDKAIVKPSELRHRITIEELTETMTDTGGISRSWSTLHEAWAKIEAKLGDENEFAQRVEQEEFYIFTIRYRAGVLERQRILHDGRIFQIKSVIIPNEIKEFLEIRALEDRENT